MVGLTEPMSAEIEGRLEKMGVEVVGEIRELNVLVAKVPEYQSTAALEKEDWIDYAEPVYTTSVEFIPNDPFFGLQWGPTKIQAPEAWNIATGNRRVLVAVLDTGVSYTHPDIAPNYVLGGYDWVNMDNDPSDDNGHGTQCAGIIAAALDNGLGIAGLAQVSLMAEKSLDSVGAGTTLSAAQAIVHAVDFGTANYDRVILSCSWGFYVDSSLVRNAIQYAYSRGCLIVASAGNDATSQPHYPSGYAEVISVSATDIDDNLYASNNFGKMDLSAPGVDIYSTFLGSGYGYRTGTSMAAAHTSGLATLFWSRHTSYSQDEIRFLMQSSSEDLGSPGWDPYFGHGRINALRLLQARTGRIVGGETLEVDKLRILSPYLYFLAGLAVVSLVFQRNLTLRQVSR